MNTHYGSINLGAAPSGSSGLQGGPGTSTSGIIASSGRLSRVGNGGFYGTPPTLLEDEEEQQAALRNFYALHNNSFLAGDDERRPIIGADCLKHRYYLMAASSGGRGATSASSTVCTPAPHRNPFAPPVPQRAPAAVDDDEDGINCSPCCDNDNIRRTFRSLILGQILSLCLCGTGVSSTLLANKGVNTPAAQGFVNYFLLCFVYGTALSCKSGDEGMLAVIRRRGWKYFLLAFIDVEANYMIVYAYQYTTLTSVQLLDCSTIPTVLLLSWLFLSVRYKISHIIGVCICLVGIACIIWADILDGKGTAGGSNRLLGDMLCLGGSLLYSVANVSEEFLVKQHSRVEYLGMVGLFGSLIAGIQLAIFEHRQLASIEWGAPVVGNFALFGISMFIFYSLVTVVLQKSSALMFNLAVLTADFYSLLFGLFLFKDHFHILYFVSFFVVIIGSVIYSLRPTAQRDPDEPRRVCPCLFACCCCCCDCCFERDDESSRGSFNVTPSPLHSGRQSAVMQAIPMYTSTDPRFCPVHGRGRRNSGPRPSAAAVHQPNGFLFDGRS